MRKNILFFLTLITFFVFTTVSFCVAADIDTILSNIEKKNSSVKDMQANYSQTVTYISTGEQTKSEGVFKHKKQDYVSLIQVSPERQYVYIDGKTITTYVPSNRQAIVEKWKNVVENDVMLTSVFKFSKNFKLLKKDYNIKLQDETEVVYSFLITPKDKKENWSMLITINKSTYLVTASSFDNGNFKVDIEINNYKTNNNFSNDIFKFVAPKNVDVIEL